MAADILKVTFIDSEGLERRPIAHTCGFTPEIPSTYESLVQF